MTGGQSSRRQRGDELIELGPRSSVEEPGSQRRELERGLRRGAWFPARCLDEPRQTGAQRRRQSDRGEPALGVRRALESNRLRHASRGKRILRQTRDEVRRERDLTLSAERGSSRE